MCQSKAHAAFNGAHEARRLAVLAGSGEDDSEVYENAARMCAHAALQCQTCRTIGTRSRNRSTTHYGQCKAEWDLLRNEAECAHCHTNRALEANHLPLFSENAKAYAAMIKTDGRAAADARYPPETRKLGNLSKATKWCSEARGGVEAMHRELKKCEWLCRCCHALDPSGSQSQKKAANPNTVRREDYNTNGAFCIARCNARYLQEKRAYINALKRAVGYCERIDCPEDGPNGGACDAGFEACFDWDHQDELTKIEEVADIARRQPLATAKPRIDAEVRKCRLLCRNCHITKPQWLAAAPAGYAHFWDAHRPLAV